MENDILSLVILTRNRCETLKRSLLYHCEALSNKDLEKTIKIYVIDNGSTDNTSEYLNELCLQFKNIVVIKNGKNIGADNSLLVGLESVKSRYVWCLQDHAQVFVEQLPDILSLLQVSDREHTFICAPLKTINKYSSSSDQKLHAILNSVTLNVNIFNRALLLPFYRKHLIEFQGSGLIFFLANIEMVIHYGIERMLILPNFVTVNEQFLVPQERDKYNWQKSFSGYTNVTLGYARIISYIIEHRILTEEIVKRFLSTSDQGLNALRKFIRLRKIKSDDKVPIETAQIIANVPTYSRMERYLIIKSISGSNTMLILLKFFDLFLVGYFRIKAYAKAAVRKIKSVARV
ncbi:MAG: glycosyltransferase family 2 protein [Methylococcaceae bacterium]